MRKLALLFLTVPTLWAQTPQPAPETVVLKLSLKKAVELALAPDGSPRVQLALEEIRTAQSRSAETRASLLPNVDGGFTYRNFTNNLKTFGIELPSIMLPGVNFSLPTLVGPVNVYDARLTGSQTIFDFSSIRRLQSSWASVRAAKADAQGTRDEVADQVAKAYLSAIHAEAVLDTALANVKLSDELARLALNEKNAGTGTGIEVTRARVQLANDRQALEVARSQVDLARLNLLRAIGLSLAGQVELTDKLSYEPVDVVTPEQAWKTAQAKRAELQAQGYRETGARLSYSAAKWRRLPSLEAFGDYGTIGAATDQLSPTRTIGVTLNVPIFDGGRRDAQRAEALSGYRQEQIRMRDLRQQVELEIRQALDSFRSAQAQYSAAREGLQLADQEVAQARRRYEAGVTTSVEVTDAQTRLERARENLVTALYNYNLARIDLSTATGAIQEFVNK